MAGCDQLLGVGLAVVPANPGGAATPDGSLATVGATPACICVVLRLPSCGKPLTCLFDTHPALAPLMTATGKSAVVLHGLGVRVVKWMAVDAMSPMPVDGGWTRPAGDVLGVADYL